MLNNPIAENKEKIVTQRLTDNFKEENPKEDKEKYSLTWTEVMTLLAQKVRKITFDTWLSKLRLIEIQNDLALIAVKNEFSKNFIKQSYIKVIQECLLEVTGASYGIRLEIQESIDDIELDEVQLPEQSTKALPEQKSIANLEEEKKKKTKLNPKISLENTYIGDFNRTCFAFSKSLIEDRHNLYNSLFIHSNSGLGKSHFLNLIGNELSTQNKDIKVKYISSESFTNDLIMSIQKNRTQGFRDKFRDLDVLLFDDFQFLENKKTCQEEFVHTFESITEKGGKVIIAANKNLDELKTLNKKLVSILKSGLVSTINEPEAGDKNLLIDFKLNELKLRLKDNHKDILYKAQGSCIRELEGNLLQISALQRFSNLDTESEEFTKTFEVNFAPKSRGLSIQKIISAVSEYFYIEEKDLTGRKRNEEYTKARHLAIYLANKLLGLSHKKIGSCFSDRKHSSIIHSIKTIEQSIESKLPSSAFIRTAISEIKKQLSL